MSKLSIILLRLTSLLIPMLYTLGAYASRVDISGVIKDIDTGKVIPNAIIIIKGADYGLMTDSIGRFSFKSNPKDSIHFSSIGYSPITISAEDLLKRDGNIDLKSTTTSLNEVVVKPHKEKYSNKNNPAFELMKKARDNAKTYNPATLPNYSYNYYTRTMLALADSPISPELLKSKMYFMADYADTAIFTRKPIMIISLKEKSGTKSYHNTKENNYINGVKTEGIDEKFNTENISIILDDILHEVNIYHDDINLLQNRFVSPLGRNAEKLYRYYITDTISNSNIKREIEVSFAPESTYFLGFNGTMLIEEHDSACYIKSIYMRVPRGVNINYADNIYLLQRYYLDDSNHLHKLDEDISMEIQFIPGTQSFYARRRSRNAEFSYIGFQPSSKEKYQINNNNFLFEKASNRPSVFWDKYRLIPLSTAEDNIGNLMGKLRRIPWFYATEKILAILVDGFWLPTEKFPVAFGPINSLISYNAIEGCRFRIGGVTNVNLSKHLFFDGYAAYGLRDHRWKYKIGTEYSFNEKKYSLNEYPIHSISLSHQYDLDPIGQGYRNTNPDNIFYSLKREYPHLSTYLRESKLEYTSEFNSNFSITAGIRHQIQEATQYMPFIDGKGDVYKNYSSTGMHIILRWAPGEKYINGRTSRTPINEDTPIISLYHEYAPKNIFGAPFCINTSVISLHNRFRFSIFGYMDITLKGGYVWSEVPYTALLWPTANLSYIIQPECYALLNPMEFANDKFASLYMTYNLNGLIFNRIPYIKKAKIREIITFKALAGSLSDKNNPKYNADLYKFPTSAIAEKMTSTPYMEFGIGLDNIFTILRIDYVWRLTYRNSNPGIDKSGLKVGLHFKF